jgi:hypothetical protein
MCIYHLKYDFGDYWEVKGTLEKWILKQSTEHYSSSLSCSLSEQILAPASFAIAAACGFSVSVIHF